MPTPSPKRILIVSVNWLGDLLFMTPAIRAIRRAHPKSFIACLAPPRGLDLLSGNPHLDAVIPLAESRGFLNLFRLLLVIPRIRRERFDVAFLFHRSFSRALLAWAAGIPCRIGYRTWKRSWLLTHAIEPPPADSVHKAVWFLKVVQAAGIPSDGLSYDVGVFPKDSQAVEALLEEWGVGSRQRLVALHPGANWKLKRWPAHHFAQLADRLNAQHGVKVLFLGDRGDLPLVEKIVGQMRTEPFVATGKTTFLQSAALLKRATLLVSNDSGPLHLGLGVGTPVVGLFGPTDPQLTGPLDESKGVALFGSIGCPVPCYQLQCPVNLCMQQISVEQVVEAAGRVLREGRESREGEDV